VAQALRVISANGPWRNPAFRWLVAGRNIDAIGNSIAPVALAFAVLDITDSKTALGLVVGARTLANVLLVLFGGVFADRLPTRLVVVGSAWAAAVTQAVVAALVLTGQARIWLLIVMGVLNGAVSAIALPASSALVPQTVAAQDIQRGNAVLRVGLNSAGLLGVALGAQLVAFAGPGWGIAVDAVSFALSAVAFARIKIQPAAPAVQASVVADLRDGWNEFVKRRWVWVVVVQFAVVNAAAAGVRGVLAPLVADDTFGRHAYGWVLTVFTVGLLAGSLIAVRLQPQRALLFGTAAILLLALPPLALALSTSAVPVAIAYFVSALAFDQFGVAWDVSLQQNVPADKLARVYSYDMLGSLIAVPVGQVVVAPLAGAFGLHATLLGCAAAIVVATVLALADRSVRTLKRQLPQEV
jgi:MFS family permease